MILQITPNYDIVTNRDLVNEQVENFIMLRYQIDSDTDLKIIDGSPIEKKLNFLGYT
jgi:methyl coenzyme M reductase beta subunit